jgi:hypothetical protein
MPGVLCFHERCCLAVLLCHVAALIMVILHRTVNWPAENCCNTSAMTEDIAFGVSRVWLLDVFKPKLCMLQPELCPHQPA